VKHIGWCGTTRERQRETERQRDRETEIDNKIGMRWRRKYRNKDPPIHGGRKDFKQGAKRVQSSMTEISSPAGVERHPFEDHALPVLDRSEPRLHLASPLDEVDDRGGLAVVLIQLAFIHCQFRSGVQSVQSQYTVSAEAVCDQYAGHPLSVQKRCAVSTEAVYCQDRVISSPRYKRQKFLYQYSRCQILSVQAPGPVVSWPTLLEEVPDVLEALCGDLLLHGLVEHHGGEARVQVRRHGACPHASSVSWW
jgi:hypothetical protein